MRVAARGGKAAHIRHGLDRVGLEEAEKILQAPGGVADGEDWNTACYHRDMRIPAIAIAVTFALAALGDTARAQTDSTKVVLYSLEPASTFQWGCYGPCECAIQSQPIAGTFQLRFVRFDGLYDEYDISDVQWYLPDATAKTAIRGSGMYRVGGEFAILHQMNLDLTFGEQPAQHFDSGLIPGGGEFPAIKIQVSVHGMLACVDTVIQMSAAPAKSSGVDGEENVQETRLDRVAPNPFTDRAEIHLSLTRASRAEVHIFDIQGRAVRRLVQGALTAGPHTLVWDGRDDGGSESATGLYFIVARVGGVNHVRRLVRMK